MRGRVIVNEGNVPLAVRTEAIQPFRDFQVVYARYGNENEVRMLRLGRRGAEYTEVLSGIEPGPPYVTEGSVLGRAVIAKSGASHTHSAAGPGLTVPSCAAERLVGKKGVSAG